MEAVSFYEFGRKIHRENRRYASCDEPVLKQVSIGLGDGISMCLSAQELQMLDSMFSEAGALLETYRILDTFAE